MLESKALDRRGTVNARAVHRSHKVGDDDLEHLSPFEFVSMILADMPLEQISDQQMAKRKKAVGE